MALEYFTEAELRALPQMANTTTYSSARILLAAAYVVAVIERVVGTSFVPRAVTAEVHDGGGYGIALRQPYVLSTVTATENGVAVTDTLRVKDGVLLRFSTSTSVYPRLWLPGVGNVSLAYTSGYSTVPPADVKEAAMQATRARLLSTNSNADYSDRRTSLNTEAGTVNFVIAGEDRPTGYPEVDAVIIGWREQLSTSGFA